MTSSTTNFFPHKIFGVFNYYNLSASEWKSMQHIASKYNLSYYILKANSHFLVKKKISVDYVWGSSYYGNLFVLDVQNKSVPSNRTLSHLDQFNANSRSPKILFNSLHWGTLFTSKYFSYWSIVINKYSTLTSFSRLLFIRIYINNYFNVNYICLMKFFIYFICLLIYNTNLSLLNVY